MPVVILGTCIHKAPVRLSVFLSESAHVTLKVGQVVGEGHLRHSRIPETETSPSEKT